MTSLGVDLLTSFDDVMLSSDMQKVSTPQTTTWPANSRVYEDLYSIVACFYYDSFGQLLRSWLDAQELLVSLLNANLPQGDSKSWDGYLVLLTGGSVSRSQALALTEIRSNTRRVRKVVITADDLRASHGDVMPSLRRNLGPVLPVAIQVQPRPTDPLVALPDRLSHSPVRTEQIGAVLRAYRGGTPLLSALHDYLEASRGAVKDGLDT